MQISAMSARGLQCVQSTGRLVVPTYCIGLYSTCVYLCACNRLLNFTLLVPIEDSTVQVVQYIWTKRRAENVLMALYRELKLIGKGNFVN